jgi:putative CocE/NonD family hydrolase
MRSMQLRSLLCLAAFAPVLCLAQDKLTMRILVNGSPVGENVYQLNSDGSFSSKSNLDLGSIKMLGTVAGHLKDGKLIDATSDNNGPGGSAKIVYANGRVDVTAKGKTVGDKWEDKTGALGGNMHPQAFASTLLLAEKAAKANPATATTTLIAYFIDGGVVLPLKVTLLQPQTLEIDGQKVAARHFTIDAAGVKMDLYMDAQNHIAAEDIPSQHIRFLLDGWDVAFVDPMTKFPELSQATYKTIVDKGVHMKTRDGVDLVCDVVRPNDDQKHPAILTRTPYGRGAEAAGGQFYASRGYVFVAQDCRGREDSAGEWDPFVHEGPDGYDTVQWVASQPWCNGKVGMIGGSYGGLVQWSAAVLHPPALKCIVPQVSPPDAMHNLPYDNGVFMLYGGLWWSKIVAGRHTDFSSIQSSLPHPEKFNTLPLGMVDQAVLGQHLDFFSKWLSRPTIGDWKGWDYTYHLGDSHVPALHISGIWDGDEIGTHMNWAKMRELKRTNQWIIFGPWVHAFNTNHSFGGVEYGPDAIIDLDSVFLRWFDTWLKGKDVGFEKRAHAKLFVTGANKWIDLPNWPAPSTPPRTLYLAKSGLAKTAGPGASAGYTYDPAKDNKVPAALLDVDPTKATTRIPAEQLKKGLFLTTPVLAKDTAIAAPFDIKLYFTSSAVDTDFFAMVVDVDEKGVARMIGQPGKIRGSYLNGMDAVRPLKPGKEYLAKIVPWDFAHEFKKGHRIGLAVVSSMFPSYARNLGTAESIKTGTRMVVQKNRILMGGSHPSSLTFHVLWEK